MTTAATPRIEDRESVGDATVPTDPSRLSGEPRMVSLDVFRGLTIAAMILVNNPGTWSSVYPPLRHAEWNGWTPTDLVFPFFLFIVGVAMTLSFARRIARGDSRSALARQVIRRTVIIFALGLILNGFPYFELSKIRIPGVLQRIALCYCFGAVIYLSTRIRGQIIATVTLLAGYWLLMTTVPVPGVGSGSLTMQANLAAYIDNTLLHGHIYRPTWDPEGILSTLPAIATVLLGVLTGQWLRVARTPLTRMKGMLAAGALGILTGQGMSFWFPINKNLWTSSYAVFTAGMALVLFALCYWFIDVKSYRKWATPFVVYGMNAIAVYVLSGLEGKASITWKVTQADGEAVLIKSFLYSKFFAPWAAPINASLMWAMAYVLFWLGVMWIFYWRKVFVKI